MRHALGLKVRVRKGLPCSPPLFITRPRWGGVVVCFPFATNRGFSRFAPLPIGGQGAVSRGTRIFEDCRSALPLTLIVYHIRAHLSRVLGEKYYTNIRHFSIKYLCNLYNKRKSARCAPQRAAKPNYPSTYAEGVFEKFFNFFQFHYCQTI